MFWLWPVISALAFAAGFALAWLHWRRRLQARMDAELERLVRAEMQRKLRDKISGQSLREHLEQSAAQHSSQSEDARTSNG